METTWTSSPAVILKADELKAVHEVDHAVSQHKRMDHAGVALV